MYILLLVQCPELSDPIHGITSCLLINRPSFSYEDTCSFRCDIGYELHDSNNRTCQSDGNWSGADATCRRGTYLILTTQLAIVFRVLVNNKLFVIVSCSSLTNPNNGMINCSLGDDGIPSYEDICGFTCNIGYEPIGSSKRTCQSDGSWTGTDAMCRRGNVHNV